LIIGSHCQIEWSLAETLGLFLPARPLRYAREQGNGIPMRWRMKFSRSKGNTMFKSHPAVSRMALAAALFCSTSAAFAADVNPAPGPLSRTFLRASIMPMRRVGMQTAPADPNAPPGPPSRRPPPWPAPPESTPPMPFADWPQGGVDYIGESTPNAVDSP